LKYVGVGVTALGWILCALLLVGAVLWLFAVRPWAAASEASVRPIAGGREDDEPAVKRVQGRG
jgi:hypothetical protein